MSQDSVPDQFRAFTARNVEGGFERGVTELHSDDLPVDGVLIAVSWSSVNYKDALAASATGRVARISPLVVGIDLAGKVVESDVDWLEPGDLVIAHGYELGVSRHGGFAEFARVPAEWIVPLPPGLTMVEAMTIGTAGYTAALSIVALQDHGISPGQGAVLVTGATGGVGSMAVSILARLGHEVVASTGKAEAASYLRSLGAHSVVDRSDLSEPAKPLLPATWVAAVDCVGGDTLAHVIASLAQGGVVTACGNTGGIELRSTVLPFILRGVALLGIDSVQTPIEHRRSIWKRLGTDLKPDCLEESRHNVGLNELDATLTAVLQARVQGRFVVDVARD